MPEESINIFINNIYSTAIFAGVFAVMFAFLFFLSRILIHKAGGRNKSGEGSHQQQFFSPYEISRDTGHIKTLIVTGLIFILAVFFIFLTLLTVYFAGNFIIDGSLYLIFITVFLILVITVYIARSGIINR